MELEWLKKKLPAYSRLKRELVEWDHQYLSIRRQCQLLGLPRSTLYTPASVPDAGDLQLMRLLDEQYLQKPFFGSRRMCELMALGG